MKQKGLICFTDIEANNYDRIESLLKNDNADPDDNSIGQGVFRSLLLYATTCKKVSIVHLLLNYNADPNLSNESGDIPLHYAGWHCSETIPLLLEYGSEIDVSNMYNHTPLVDAIRNSNEEAVHLLLDAGAKMTYVNVVIPDWVEEILAKRSKTKCAITAFFALNKRTKKVHKDLVAIIGEMIWATRRDDVWEKTNTQRKNKKFLK